MKNILILGIGKNTGKLVNDLYKYFPEDVCIENAGFEDVLIDIDEKYASIMIAGKNIFDYDLVYFRRAGKKYIWLAATIALFLEYNNKKYLDTTYQNIGPGGTKLTSFLKFSLMSFPIPTSIYCHKDNIKNNMELIINRLGFPIVAKELYSQRGKGVFLIKTKEKFVEFIEEHSKEKFMFQKYIDKKEEFRVLVLGNEIGAFERKTSDDPEEFRNNVCLGAKEEFIEIEKIPKDIKDISIKAAKALKLEIAGVDIVVDSSGKILLLEVNRGPGFTYNSNVSPEIKNLAKYFINQIRNV